MLPLVADVLTHAAMITSFVFVVMVVIEYLNVLTAGVWQRGLRGNRWRQYLLSAALGATPGCLGAFAIAALYSHRVVTLGAVVAAMIATSGDEAFVMLSMAPGTAWVVFLVLFGIGIAAGVLTDLMFDGKRDAVAAGVHGLDLHTAEVCQCYPRGRIADQWRHCTLARGVLAMALAAFLFGLFTGQVGPPTWTWIRATLVLTTGVGFFIVATVPDHFLKEHLWDHVAKAHVPRVFLWTLGALITMHLLVDYLHLELWLRDNQLILLAAACLLGLVPESGPHLVFLTLYVQGSAPLSILLASSVVQDGHGMLPILAESRGDFLRIKGINLMVGALVGLTGYATGW